MCIHHISLHTSCGHTTQSASHLVHCRPVDAALEYYNRQPELARSGQGRFANNPMKPPQPCGGRDIRLTRNIVFIGQDRTFVPEGWQVRMTKLLKFLLEKGEDPQSIIILMETEFPDMVDKISEKWVRHVRECLWNPDIDWSPPQDLQNDGLAGSIITNTVDKLGCGGLSSGNPNCFTGWPNPYGGTAYCPFRLAMETGMPMPRRPEHDHAGESKSFNWLQQLDRELRLQAWDRMRLQGSSGHGSKGDISLSSPKYSDFTTSIMESPQTVQTRHADLVVGLRSSTSNYCWPPEPKPEDKQGHAKSASI
ncbi:MAG: hypothetical protein Q9215_003348 [Flavoplaca cf. flavocitrina]